MAGSTSPARQLQDANFDGAVCVACNLTNARLDGASFTGAYLPGVTLSGPRSMSADFDRAWLYCGGLTNSTVRRGCPGVQPPHWDWPLALGSGEAFGPVPFGRYQSDRVQLFDDVSTCPDGAAGRTAPAACWWTEAEPPGSDSGALLGGGPRDLPDPHVHTARTSASVPIPRAQSPRHGARRAADLEHHAVHRGLLRRLRRWRPSG